MSTLKGLILLAFFTLVGSTSFLLAGPYQANTAQNRDACTKSGGKVVLNGTLGSSMQCVYKDK